MATLSAAIHDLPSGQLDKEQATQTVADDDRGFRGTKSAAHVPGTPPDHLSRSIQHPHTLIQPVYELLHGQQVHIDSRL